MESITSNNREKKTGFYVLGDLSSCQKPSHLEERFRRELKIQQPKRKKDNFEAKQAALLEARKRKSDQRLQKVKQAAKEAKDKQEDRLQLLSKSMAIAELNRNIYIEKRRAYSKRTVDRAKHVALQNQKRSKQEQERRRAELESRLEKTEERRLAHLSRYKLQKKVIPPSSFTSTNSKDNMPATSAKKIATPPLSPSLTAPKKKPSSWSIILKAFKDLGLPLPSSPDTWLEFNALGQLLHQPKVIVITTKVLNTALKMVDEESRHRARILLTSYMTLMCPKEVLQDVNGTEEMRLHAAAKEMLQLFEAWLKAHGRPGATAARMAFVSAWDDYTMLFESWKSRDCDQLVKNMISYYVELSTLRQTIIAQNHGDETVGEQLKQQLEQIKVKLQKLGGNDALNSLQRALESSASSTSTGRKRQQQNSTPRSSDDMDLFEQRQQQEKSEQLGRLLDGFAQSDSGLTNEFLAHELIMDPEFKLQHHESSNELEKRVRLMAEKAFFDKLEQDIRQGKADSSLPSVIQDVKTRMLSLVRPHSSLYKQVDEAIDLSLIKQQIKQHSFDMQHMISYVLNTMSGMCAPVRDQEIQGAKASESMIEQMKLILTILDNMNLDLANFRLRSLRPHLMSIAIEYERNKFAAMLNQGTIQLVRTKTWLTESTKKLCQVAAQRNPENILPEKNNKPSHDTVFEEAFVSLLVQPEPIVHSSELPETLYLDVKRMSEYQNEVQATTMVAALLMLAKNFGSIHQQQLSRLASRLFTMLEDSTTSIDNLASEIETSANVRSERKAMVRTMVDKTINQTDTVYSLLSRRIASVIRNTIQNNQFVTEAVLTSNGLDPIRAQLQSISLKIQQLANHNRKVYSSWYNDIITEALNDNAAVSSQ
ncbi:T-complex protein 11-domain-containing protein [Blakeslea trispora]|nr:T-complex protein 11-domain-containing protein [Blakeslea trispora]